MPGQTPNEFVKALRCEIADPLWMLNRQWVMQEFRGEDNGSPLFARLDTKSKFVQKILAKDKKSQQLCNTEELNKFPLEPLVEREIFDLKEMDLQTRLEIGQLWIDLGEKGDKYKFNLEEQAFTEPEAKLFVQSINNKFTDGYRILTEAIPDILRAATFSDSAKYSNFLTTCESILGFKPTKDASQNDGKTAWDANRMEYTFEIVVDGENTNDAIHLNAEEYYHGNLEWYNLDFKQLGNGQAKSPETKTHEFIPNLLKFPGMPNKRWWAFEDGRINFHNLEVGRTDLTTMVMSRFMLLYSNDWYLLPFEQKVGSLTQITQLKVTDVFGCTTDISPAIGNNSPTNQTWETWNLFNLAAKSGDNNNHANYSGLFIPDTLTKTLEGEPLELVSFYKDEMANMVWGIEERVESKLGGGTDYYQNNDPQAQNSQSTLKVWEYVLANSVPLTMVPFQAKQRGDQKDGQIQFRRSRMGYDQGKVIEKDNQKFTRATFNGQIMEPNTSKFYIHEEEIPQTGIKVTRTWQRTRLKNGGFVCWIGRQKSLGRGGLASGLAFDQLVYK